MPFAPNLPIKFTGLTYHSSNYLCVQLYSLAFHALPLPPSPFDYPADWPARVARIFPFLTLPSSRCNIVTRNTEHSIYTNKEQLTDPSGQTISMTPFDFIGIELRSTRIPRSGPRGAVTRMVHERLLIIDYPSRPADSAEASPGAILDASRARRPSTGHVYPAPNGNHFHFRSCFPWACCARTDTGKLSP